MNFSRKSLVGVIIAAVFLSACGKNQPQKSTTSGNEVVPTDSMMQPLDASRGNDYTREELLAYIANADRRFKNAPKDDPLETVTARQYASTEVLLAIARALDTEGTYSDQIEGYQDRFIPKDNTAALGRRLLDSMLGMYSATAMLFTMRFQHSPEKLKVLEVVGKDIESMMARNDPIIKPIARMSNTMYQLLSDILEDIDRGNSLDPLFARSDSLYKIGVAAAQTDEDRYLNALYRIFEVGQIWVLQLSPSQTEKTSKLKKTFTQNLMASENIGEQMAVSSEYIYRTFRLVAMLTLDVIYTEKTE